MDFEEAFEKDLGVLTSGFVKDVESGEKQPSLHTFKLVWKNCMFSGVHQAKARRLSWRECLQVLYATVLKKLRESLDGDDTKLVPIALVYALLCLYHTQPRSPRENVRLRLCDFQRRHQRASLETAGSSSLPAGSGIVVAICTLASVATRPPRVTCAM